MVSFVLETRVRIEAFLLLRPSCSRSACRGVTALSGTGCTASHRCCRRFLIPRIVGSSVGMRMTGGSSRRALSFFVFYPARFPRLIPSDPFFRHC